MHRCKNQTTIYNSKQVLTEESSSVTDVYKKTNLPIPSMFAAKVWILD